MIWLYRCLINLAIPFGLLALLIRGLKNPEYWRRWPERFGFANAQVKSAAPYDLWIHAVSVGEARAAAPLVQAFLKTQPQAKILVTTTTPTGSAMVGMQLNDTVQHCYFPYDLAWAMRRFANLVSAKTVLIMETEIWPNMIAAVKASGSQLIYTNVRLSERSYLDRKHLESLGVLAERITETGSIKFDVTIAPSLRESAEVLRRQLGQDRLIWIAGSTRENEESKVLAVFKKLKEQFPSLLLLLVPRHPERFDYIARKTQRRELNCVRRTEQADLTALPADVDVYLGDTMGELSLMYAASDVAFVGGSLEPLGGQNILEPCALGVPVVFGPHMFNFPDISRWTIKEGAGRMVHNETELLQAIAELLSNPSLRDEMGNKGVRFIEAHKGALAKNSSLIENLTKSTV